MISKNYEKVHSHIQELMEKIQFYRGRSSAFFCLTEKQPSPLHIYMF